MRKKIQILDQAEFRYTTRNRAGRFVRDGRATWVEPGVSIRFVADHHAHRSAVLRALAYDPTRLGYDRIDRSLTERELRGLPFAGDVSRLLGRGQQRHDGAKQAS